MSYPGLTSGEAKALLEKFDFNEIKEKKPNAAMKFFKWLLSPIAIMLLAAALLSLFIGKDFDFCFILVLMLINFLVGYWQEKKADHAIAKLREKLTVQVSVLRDKSWRIIPSKMIVPGDIIELNLGDIIPADLKILEQKNLTANEASLTGESLPKEKNIGDTCFSGSFVASGWGRAEVTETGNNTYFGHILISMDTNVRRSLLEQDILNISKMLSFLSFIAVSILTIIFIFQGKPFLEILTLDLSLIIAGIPISLPTIMTLIISFGVLDLAKKKTVVRRLSALEDLANVTMLLSDKTGTLTKNEINIEKIVTYNGYTENDIINFAALTTREHDKNAINQAILRKKLSLGLKTNYSIIDFTPFDSEHKRSTALVKNNSETLLISAGAAQIIESFCVIDEVTKKQLERDNRAAAAGGYRTIMVAVKITTEENESAMTLAGMLLFSDTLEKGVQKTIDFIKQNGIGVKMLTGDNHAIAQRVAQDLGLTGEVVSRSGFGKNFSQLTPEEFGRISVFSEIMPQDKSDLVSAAKKNGFIVAVTGDGINDLPALKAASVGIAVKNAVDTLKSAADLTLFSQGISVIRDAVIESRKIFARLYAYSVYRISESFRIIITIALLGLVYGTYPLAPIQLILLALLNDIPIISLAFNRVRIATKPSAINAKERLKYSLSFGMVGVLNSFLFFFIAKNIFHLDWEVLQTLFFLKLTISGHMLIYVAHTKERWWKFLPSASVIWATSLTQLFGTILAVFGIFMHKAPLNWIIFIWLWALFWTQISELSKFIIEKISANKNVIQ